MLPPFIIEEQGAISFRSSVKTLTESLEPEDVKNGEYVVYDSEGRLVILGTALSRKKSFFSPSIEKVSIVSIQEGEQIKNNLSEKLLLFLCSHGMPESLMRKADLKELISVGMKIADVR